MVVTKRKEGRLEAARAIGRFFVETGRAVSQHAKEAQDAMVLLKHSSACREELAAQQRRALLPAGDGTHVVLVEVLAAADLCQPRFGDLAVYCTLVIGPVGKSWDVQVAQSLQVKTHVVLRDRHPRWSAVCTLPLPRDASERGGADLELAVRVMNACALRSDKLLGEVRIPLSNAMKGASTFRLMGGGHASISLRWSTTALESRTGHVQSISTLEEFTADGTEALRDEARSTFPCSQLAVPVHSGISSDVSHESEDHIGRRKKGEHSELGSPEVPVTTTEGMNPFDHALAFWTLRSVNSFHDVSEIPREVVSLLSSGCSGSGSHSSHGGSDGSVSAAVVNELILQAPLAKLLCDDREMLGSVLDAITGQMSSLLPLARSRIVGAIVERIGYLGSDACANLEELMLCNLLQNSSGNGLAELKMLIDKAGTDRDLRHVIFVAIKDTRARESILAHFQEEARFIARPLHVISDIDMTIWVGAFGSGGPKFPQGPVPGSMCLFSALSGCLAFLSARPPIWEGRTRRLLMDEVGIAEAVVLPGTLRAVVQTIFQPGQGHRAMGERKLEVFGQFAQLHPEARFVFVGDSGEGDVDFALAFMAASSILPKDRRDRVALIHDVVHPDGVRPKTPTARRAELRLGGVIVFDTFAGAALELHQLGFLDVDGLRSAAHGCLDEFAELPAEDFFSVEVFETRRSELLKDLRNVNAALREAAMLADRTSQPNRSQTTNPNVSSASSTCEQE